MYKKVYNNIYKINWCIMSAGGQYPIIELLIGQAKSRIGGFSGGMCCAGTAFCDYRQS